MEIIPAVPLHALHVPGKPVLLDMPVQQFVFATKASSLIQEKEKIITSGTGLTQIAGKAITSFAK